VTTIVIVCESCTARYRMDTALLQDSKAARFRCRKCGEYIEVRLPEESPAPPVAVAEPLPDAPPPEEPKAVEPPAPGPEEEPGPPPAVERAAPEPERRESSRRPPSMLAILLISVVWILLLTAGALYFGTMQPGQEGIGRLFARWGSSRTGSAPEKPVYDIRDVKWYAERGSDGANLLVIKGSVANIGNVASAGILIHATLLGMDNVALAEKAAFAGNLLDNSAMQGMQRAEIDGAMSKRYGEGNLNREIPKGKAVPFMVIFIDPQGKVESFTVRAIDAE